MLKKKITLDSYYKDIEYLEQQHQKEEEYRPLVELYLLKSHTQDSKYNSIYIRKCNRFDAYLNL